MDPTSLGFRHAYPLQVRWSDMDALGHVNNARFLTYMEQARIAYATDLALWDGDRGTLGLIMARAVVDFKLPLLAADEVYVLSRCIRLGRRSFDMEQWVVRASSVDPAAPEISAQGVITMVVYDYRANQSAPIPDRWRSLVKSYELAPPQE